MERERLGSRLGFILLSAGCAIGVGNVWKFPYITGQYGGGTFVLVYLVFLLAMGIPMVTAEFAIGRASRKSPLLACAVLQKPGGKWHWQGYMAMAGNYLLMKGNLQPEDIVALMKDTFRFVATYEGEVPGTTPADCGNYLLHDLPMARWEAAKYLHEVLEQMTEENMRYPEKKED